MSGEYRGKITIEADDRAARVTHQSVKDLTGSFVGLQTVTRGAAQVLRGNAMGMVELATGASLVWKTLTNLNPILRAISIALAVLPPIVGAVMAAFGKSREIDDFAAKLKKLGLIESDLEKLNAALKRHAEGLRSMKDNADAAAGAYDRLLAAQRAVAAMNQDLAMTKLDLQERQELANPNLTDPERRTIRQRYAERRIDLETDAKRSDIELRRNALSNELQQVRTDRDMLQGQEGMIGNALKDAVQLAMSKVEGVVAAGGKATSAEMGMRYAVISGDYDGALNAGLEDLFSDIPEAAKDAAKEAADAIKAALGLRDEYRSMTSTDAQKQRKALADRERAIQMEAQALFDQDKGLNEMAQMRKSTVGAEINKEAVDERRAEQVQKDRERASMRDGLARERVAADRKAAEDRAMRDEQMAYASTGMSALRRGSAMTIDTSEIFDAMHAGGAGKTDWGKQILEDRAAQQVDLLKIIANNTKAESV